MWTLAKYSIVTLSSLTSHHSSHPAAMETGGGFHGYRKLPTNTNSSAGTLKLSVSEMNTRQQVGEQNNNSHSSAGTEQDNECIVREQDRFMPIANVIRIMRKILPPHAKISDDAKETIQECVSEYISFITGEANERCQREQRKTITAEDVLWAMSKLGFDDYIEPLTMYLHRYRELEGDRTSMRVEPLGKRGMEYGNLGGFVPQFHIGHPNGGYYGNAAPTYMMRDGNNNATNAAAAAGGSSHSQALANAEANGHHHHQYK